MTISFRHTITQGEHSNSHYIGLGSYGKHFPPNGTKLVILDQAGRKSYANKVHDSQITGATQWFRQNEIVAGTVIEVRHDPNEMCEGRPVVHLAVVDRASAHVDALQVPTRTRSPRKTAGVAPQPLQAPEISVTMLEETKRSMPAEQFQRVWGGLYERLVAAERARLTTPVTQSELGDRAQRIVRTVHGFLTGKSNEAPAQEVICSWIHTCYVLELHREAAALLKHLEEQDGPSLNSYARRLAEASRARLGW